MKNKVELIGTYGTDEIIALSAWTSTSRDLTEDKRKRIPQLIDILWSQGHETPFEKATIHFLVDTDIASHIHLLKHRMSSMNAESARYKELKDDKYYLPKDWMNIQVRDSIEEFGFTVLGEDHHNEDAQTWADVLEKYTKLGNILYHRALKELEESIGRKRAKESARFFKTYNSQIQADISFNMRSFANFQKLRNSEYAQKEIKEIAAEMLRLVEETSLFKHTIETWRKNKTI